jgi:hypothetical protein
MQSMQLNSIEGTRRHIGVVRRPNVLNSQRIEIIYV